MTIPEDVPATQTEIATGPGTTSTGPPEAPTTPEGADAPSSTTPEGSTTIEIGPGAVEAPVIDAQFTITGSGVEPSRVEVPAFLTLDIAAISGDGREHTLRISTPGGPLTLAVPPGGTASNTFEGVEPGQYPIAVDGTVTDARLVVISGAGPDGG